MGCRRGHRVAWAVPPAALASCACRATLQAPCVTLLDIEPGAVPRLTFLRIIAPSLRAELPSSWGSSADTLPALVHLSITLGGVLALPGTWAAGFRRLKRLQVHMPRPWRLGGDPAAAPAARQLSDTPGRDWPHVPRNAQSGDMMGAHSATLPAEWGRNGSFPELTELELEELCLTGTIPAAWWDGGGMLKLSTL